MQLVTGTNCIDNKALCGSCGGLVLVVNGWAFPEGDVQLFNALCAAIEKSALPATDLAQLAAALVDSAMTCTEVETLELAVFWIPSLAPVCSLLASSPARARHAFSMIDLILTERSKTRDSTILSRRRHHVVGE